MRAELFANAGGLGHDFGRLSIMAWVKLFEWWYYRMSEEELFEAIQSFDQEDSRELFGTYIESIDSIFDN